MYVLKPEIKHDPARRWALPDRIFYGYGACHILAGVFLERYPDSGYWAVWLKPWEAFHGNHVFVTNGEIAFDHHGYSALDRLVAHHEQGWTCRFTDWRADILDVDFSLLETAELNKRQMRGPGQYFGDVISRTHQYLNRIDHDRQKEKVMTLMR